MISQFPLEYFLARVEATKKLLKTIEKQSQEKNIPKSEIFAYRMIDNMHNFGEQVTWVANQIEMLKVYEGGDFERLDLSLASDFASAQNLLQESIQKLQQMDQKNFENLDQKTIHLPFLPPEGMNAAAFMPNTIANLEFHITTLYNLARMHGFQIGKYDFLNVG